jgi:hypothetical protein
LRGGAGEEEGIQKDWQTDMLLGENLEIASERESEKEREKQEGRVIIRLNAVSF